MKKFLCEQDKEDFEQEQKINEWLGKRKSRWDHLGFIREHYGRKGSHRYNGLIASQSLQMEIGEDGTGTLADLIPGSDGRDLDNGDPAFHFREALETKIDFYLTALGLDEEAVKWTKKMFKLSATHEKMLSLISETDSE